jgi:predicted aspartyl protease
VLRAQEDFIAAATTDERVPIIEGVLEGNTLRFMIDSGSSVSLVAKAVLPLNSSIRMENARQLWTADGHKMGVVGTARLAVQLGEYQAVHEFLVAEELLMPVIIGVDFLSRHSVILDYMQQPSRTHSHRS